MHSTNPLIDAVIIIIMLLWFYRVGWNELLIASLAYQSTATSDCITLSRGLCVYRSNAHQLGFGVIFDRILAELVYKMQELVMDRTELGCLRAIILFNPCIFGASSVCSVELKVSNIVL